MPEYYFQYHGMFSEFNRLNAAICIQRHWREYRYNPRYRLCERVITRSLIELVNYTGINVEIKGDNEYIKYLRRKNFEYDLSITKQVLKKFAKRECFLKKMSQGVKLTCRRKKKKQNLPLKKYMIV